MKRIGWLWTPLAGVTLLVGCSPESRDTTGLPGGTTVSGHVLTILNQPASGVSVTIAGQATTRTDANGDFTVTGVNTPYDAVVVDDSGQIASLYRGLTRADPALVVWGAFYGFNRSAQLSGTIAGGDFTPNQPSEDRTRVYFASPEVSRGPFLDGNLPGTYDFGSYMVWNGPLSTTGTIHVLQAVRDSANPYQLGHYTGYGSKSGVTLSNGGSLTGQDVALSPVQEATMTGTISGPAGSTLGAAGVGLNFGAGRYDNFLLVDEQATPSFSWVTPVIPGTTLSAWAYSSGPQGQEGGGARRGSLAPDASGVTLTIPAGPTLHLPADSAVGVSAATSFTWSRFSGGVHIVQFSEQTGPLILYVFTADTATTIPDLGSAGPHLPPGTLGTWQVTGIGPVASMDALVGPTGTAVLLSCCGDFLGTADAAYGSSAWRSFTTAP
jgi:hypothetical protein